MPPGEPRVPRARRRGARRRGLPGHARRHRLAHDDGERARRARLGRRRDRGRGGDARRAALDARAAGRRLQADGRAARGRDGDRPRPDRHRRSCARPASSGSSSSTSAHGLAALPLADRATLGNMSPEYGATCGFFPVDELTLELPAADRPQRRSGSRSSRRTARRTCSGTTRATQPTYSQVVELDLGDGRAVARRARAGRRTACRSRDAKDAFLEALGTFGVDDPRRTAATTRRRRHVPGERPDDRAGARRRTRAGRRRAPVADRRPPAASACRSTASRLRARARLGRDRGDHLVHEHVEPAGDGRRRPAGEEGRRARAAAQAVGQVEPRARARRS